MQPQAIPLPERWIVTGGRGAGKTTFCARVAEWAREARWEIAGLLSLPRPERGPKAAIEVLDLRQGTRRLLATRGGEGGIRWGEWCFDPEALAWGNRVLSSVRVCDLLIVDEIGPLELEAGTGWSAALPLLGGTSYCIALVVIRPEYALSHFLRWPGSSLIVVPSPAEAAPMADRFFALLRQVLYRQGCHGSRQQRASLPLDGTQCAPGRSASSSENDFVTGLT